MLEKAAGSGYCVKQYLRLTLAKKLSVQLRSDIADVPSA